MIEITGYVTETHGRSGFTIKITNDNIVDEKGNHPEISKEKRIAIAGGVYPDQYHDKFEIIQDTHRRKKIDRCCSRSAELRKGDRVKCSVSIVEKRGDKETITYVINTNPNDIETYTKFDLWLNPDAEFKRLEVDTPQTLKFRKQNYYTEVNNRKCEKITGHSYKYEKKWWINKNPKIVFPMIWGVRFRTTLSNLWKRLTEPNNLTIAYRIAFIISLIVNIILGILYLKKP